MAISEIKLPDGSVHDIKDKAAAGHIADGDIHVTAAEKERWNGKAEKSDIPTELPANGGNADTVDGKHASDFLNHIGTVSDLFAVNQTCVCKYNEATLNTPLKKGLTNSGAGLCFVNNEAGAEYTTYLVLPAGDQNYYAATSRSGVEHVSWHKVSDGGNADTLDGKQAAEFMCSYGGCTDCNAAVQSGIYAVSPGASNTPADGYYVLAAFPRGDGTIVSQLLVDVGNTMYRRVSVSGNWGKWVRTNDGGNAASVGSYTEAKIAALEARIAALEGSK